MRTSLPCPKCGDTIRVYWSEETEGEGVWSTYASFFDHYDKPCDCDIDMDAIVDQASNLTPDEED